MAKYRFSCGCEWPILEGVPYIGEIPALDFDIDNAPDCPATWALLGRGETNGVFQVESQLGKQWCKKIRPECQEHMGALGALLRPGCIRAVDSEGVSMTAHYGRRKNGEEPLRLYHPAIDAILSPTYGVLAYQEQAMAIAQAVAGFNLQEADSLRKAIGKKLAEEMAKCRKMFIEGAKKAAILTEEQAAEVFGWIQESQRYSFNKCVSADTVIRKSAKGKYLKTDGFTVEHMYRIRHDKAFAKANGHEQLRRKWKRLGNYGKGLSQCEDGRIRPNTIADIQPAGERRVLRITLENGASIRCTDNHKFPTPDGIVVAGGLVCGDRLFVCGDYEKTDFKSRNRFSPPNIKTERVGKAVSGRFGSDNIAFTNGSFTEFENNGKLIPMECGNDSTHIGRFELHHKDGNRSNSQISNLERLCSSCHKKAEYALGRVKRGEKGYPSLLMKIEKIEEDGWCETYDVTMAAPNHNFVTSSGIVTCNSHAISYGLVGYQCAYIKAHFPLIFFTSWLGKAKDKEEVYDLVQDAKLFNIEVVPPNLLSRKADFSNNGKVVEFGISNISGVGDSAIATILEQTKVAEAILKKPLKDFTWVEFLFLLTGPGKISSDIMRSMIRVGALKWMGTNRRRMEAEYDAWLELVKKDTAFKWGIAHMQSEGWTNVVEALTGIAKTKKNGGGCHSQPTADKLIAEVKMLVEPPTCIDDTPHWISWAEETLLGISLSCSRLDTCDLSQVNTSIRDYRNGHDGFMMFGVKVERITEYKTKKGKAVGSKMGFLTVSDQTGSLENVVAFPEAYKEFGSLLTPGALLIIQGERQKDDGLSIKKVWPAS